MKLRHQGLILAEDGRKMSKRWGNVINPDDIVRTYGADTMRIFEMFQAPFDQNVSWKTESIMGSRRFIERIWRIASKVRKKADISDDLERLLHKTIKKVTEDIENLNFNTAISAMMILSNEMEKAAQVDEKSFKNFLKILAPFAPHVADELWNNLGEKKTIHHSVWPDYNPDKIKDDMVNIAIQVNGKVRGEVLVPADAPEKEIREIVLSREVIKKWIEGKAVKKFIYVPGRLANIVL
jgi:leucyl-tRNA synthetase